MPLALSWTAIAFRLLGAILAGAAIGLNRTEHGRTAGLRTSILVSLAACLAMVQVNLLLPLSGRSPNSFVMNDLMRLPLGILSGMGFIGAGAIVRRDNFISGVTTAATMWVLTVLGLCFGGGQMALGAVGAVLAIVVLEAFGLLEARLKRDRRGKLVVVTAPDGPDEREIRTAVTNADFRISACATVMRPRDGREFSCDLVRRTGPDDTAIPGFVDQLSARDGVIRVAWTPQAM